MKRNKLLPIVILLSGILFASCKKDNKALVQLEADVEEYGGKKAFVDNGNFSCFEQNDTININGDKIAVSEVSRGGRTVRLTVTASSTYKAVYPSSIVTSLSSGSTTNIPVTLPASQMYETANGHQKVNIPMCGQLTTERGIIHFHNLCALLKLEITNDVNEPIIYNSIRVSSSNCPLSGSGKIDTISSETPVIVMDASSSKSVLLTFSREQVLAQNATINYYVVVPKAVGAEDITVSMIGRTTTTSKPASVKRYVYEKSRTASFNFKRNVIYSVPFSSPTKKEEDMSFSVSPTKKVMFSSGNLQWSATNGTSTATTHAVAGGGTAPGTWRFAENQWDFVGGVNYVTDPAVGDDDPISKSSNYGTVYYNDGSRKKADNKFTAQNYHGWIDMFGWGTSGWDNRAVDATSKYYQPWDTAQLLVDATNNYWGYGPSLLNPAGPNLTGTNYDWGVYNAIWNPSTQTTDAAGTWHTFSYDELIYLLYTRTDADIKHGHAKITFTSPVNSETPFVNGLILLPDYWVLPDGITFVPGQANGFKTNKYTEAQWKILENAGAIFLPAAGYRGRSYMHHMLQYGDYHSSSYWYNAVPPYNQSQECYIPYFTTHTMNEGYSIAKGVGQRWYGRSVRLVRTVQ